MLVHTYVHVCLTWYRRYNKINHRNQDFVVETNFREIGDNLHKLSGYIFVWNLIIIIKIAQYFF